MPVTFFGVESQIFNEILLGTHGHLKEVKNDFEHHSKKIYAMHQYEFGTLPKLTVLIRT